MAWTHYSVKTKHIGVTGRESWWVITWCLYASSLFIIVSSSLEKMVLWLSGWLLIFFSFFFTMADPFDIQDDRSLYS